MSRNPRKFGGRSTNSGSTHPCQPMRWQRSHLLPTLPLAFTALHRAFHPFCASGERRGPLMLTVFRGIVYAVNFSRTIYIFIGSLSQRREWLSTNEILNGEVSISGQVMLSTLFSLIQHPSHLALVCCISIQSKKQASRRHMLREVVQGMGLCDSGVWLGKYKMERQTGTLRHGLELLSTHRISSRKPWLCA